MPSQSIVLCVDDDPSVVKGLQRILRKDYDVRTATSGRDGLDLLANEPNVAVVVSDMQMPHMDGAAFLAAARKVSPDTVRILLTGSDDVKHAAHTVSAGRLFLFLRKPCPAEDLAAAVASATEMHKLVRSERVLLQQTLVGCITAIVGTLVVALPTVASRAMRVRDLARRAAEGLENEDRWRLEFAALLSQLRTAALPPDVAERYHAGAQLDQNELALLAEGADAINRALAGIPRLESVTKILAELAELTQGYGVSAEHSRASPDALLLHAIIDIERLESAGQSATECLDVLKKRGDFYGQRTLDVITDVTRALRGPDDEARSCHCDQLAAGMVLAEDLKTNDGVLLLPCGFELSASALIHIIARFKGELPKRVKVRDNRA